MDKTIAVFGVTGQQGSWVALAFKESGYKVIGITRDASSPKAKGLPYELRQGDLCDENEVAEVVKGCSVVFALTQPWLPTGEVDGDLEERQATGLVRGCAKAGISHLIYSSVISSGRFESLDDLTKMPHTRGKFVVNRLCLELKIPITMLGPTHFMDNWLTLAPFLKVEDGRICGLMEFDTKVPYVSCRDIGKMAVVANQMGPPPNSEGRYLPVWTDFVSGKEVCQFLSKLRHGQKFTYYSPSLSSVGSMSAEMAMMKEAFESMGRPPASKDKSTLEQMYETRKLLQDDYWTLERWFSENNFATRKLPSQSNQTETVNNIE